MKHGKLQCKDIPDRPILELLAANPGRWHTYHANPHTPSVHPAFACIGYDGTSSTEREGTVRLILAKMASLIRRGLVDGCTCGCRGDFEITPEGESRLHALVTADDLRGRG